MSPCRVIICEKSPHWALALRLALAGQPPTVVEARALAQAESALAASPASLVALEATAANLNAVLDFLVHTRTDFPLAQLAVLLPEELAAASVLFREAGAIDVLTSVLDIGRLARLTRRHFALAPARAPLAIHNFVADRLPWSSHSPAPSVSSV